MKRFRKNNKIEDIKEVYYSKFLKIYEIAYKTKSGNKKTWMVASRKEKEDYENILYECEKNSVDAVSIVGYNEEKESIVLIKEFRIPINDYIYSIPAGLVDNGEDLFVTAKREMKEETGLELYEIYEEKTCKKSFASPGMSDESIAIVYGKVKGDFSKDGLEDSEDITAIYVNREEAKDLLKSDVKLDTKAWLILNYFVKIGRI